MIFLNGRKLKDGSQIPFQKLDIFAPHAFETMKVYGGVIFRLEDHIARLYESSNTLGCRTRVNQKKLETELTAIAKECHEPGSVIRFALTPAGRIAIVSVRRHSQSVRSQGIDLSTVTVRQSVRSFGSSAKSNQFLKGVLAVVDGKLRGSAIEPLMLNENGEIQESAVWNFFCIKDGTLMTPPAAGILNGVTRRFVIECARKKKIPFTEMVLTRHDAWNADEAFLTNTSGEIAPIRSLDGRLIGRHVPGRITQQLNEAFSELNHHE